MQSITSTVSVTRFDIEDFVKEATWKDILVELVKKDELNPWDIDLIDIIEKYVGAVKGMQVFDLRVPANIILAAAVLLRLKSDMLELEEKVEQQDGATEPFTRPYVPVEGLSLRLRLPPKSRVSLNELIVALEDVMKLKEYREAKIADEFRTVPLILSRADVEADIEEVYATVKKNMDSEKMVSFSSLKDMAKKDDALLDLFIPLLFLASKNRVLLIQEKFFGEILIALN
jgi:segregation and condensation protein A